MTVDVLYMTQTGTVIGALSQAIPLSTTPTARDLTGRQWPVRMPTKPDLPVPPSQLSAATFKDADAQGALTDPNGYVVTVGADGKPALATATIADPGTAALSAAGGITITKLTLPAGLSVVVVFQNTASPTTPNLVTGKTAAGGFTVAVPLAPGLWHVAWFIAGGRPGTHEGHPGP
jgi:hypothetical protein